MGVGLLGWGGFVSVLVVYGFSWEELYDTVKTRIIRFYSVNVRAHEPRKATAPASYPRLNKA